MTKKKHIKNIVSRRNFLKVLGYSAGAATVLSSCEKPIRKAIPFLNKPEEIIPGKANYYASAFYDGNQLCSIIAKVRDGRPIKIEGNDRLEDTNGGTNAIVQASILNLYDPDRLKNPAKYILPSTWDVVDKEIIEKLENLKIKNKKLVLLSSSIASPSTQKLINEFGSNFKNFEHVVHDAISYDGILSAYENCCSKRIIPHHRFDKADLIVSFGADFLGTWLSPIEFTSQYVKNRELKSGSVMSKHIQIETGLSLTGSNADDRIAIKPSEEKAFLSEILLYSKGDENISEKSKKIAAELFKFKGRALLVSGSNDIETQEMVIAINYSLESYSNTIDLDNYTEIKQDNPQRFEQLIVDIKDNKVGGIIVLDTDPLYSSPLRNSFIKEISKVDLTISLSSSPNQTSLYFEYQCPGHHYLESWDELSPRRNTTYFCQPVIKPLFNTRQAQDSLLKWMGRNITFDEYLKKEWSLKWKLDGEEFRKKWSKCLQDGFIIEKTGSGLSIIEPHIETKFHKEENKGIEIKLNEDLTLTNGTHSNNPWLQELPDPVSKICWDNGAAISPQTAEEYDLVTGDIISINGEFEIPVYIQPGQAENTLSIALGYGKKNSGKVCNEVGFDSYQLLDKELKYFSTNNSIKKTAKTYEFAFSQQHSSMEERPLSKILSLSEYDQNKKEHKKKTAQIYPEHKYEGHHWAMVIDLNKCTGCGACTVSCQAENNIPVVGPEEIKLSREMHWMKIDRYYDGSEVIRMPRLCQQCDNAPCENVCPVAATSHSSEGINQMVYNRCIGTRYCNNNCPYKVRVFNYYDYTGADTIKNNTHDYAGMTQDLRRLVLNPDVTVRAKGVMEKCSFCIQRIQERKAKAKLENRELKDGEIKTACSQVCPANAIVFGDINDPTSKVSRLMESNRRHSLLGELNTLPSVQYLYKVKNDKKA